MSALTAAAEVLGDRARRDVPIGPLTTYRVGGPAALLLEVQDEGDLALATDAVRASGVPTLVIGKGSNLLVADALAGFAGVGRRFERRGEAGGITFVDSYDHLPTEVASVLAAAATGGWRRVVCVFQPHRYTRTAALWRDFADSFVDADLVAVTGIYAAGQQPIEGVSAKLIVDAVLDAHPRTPMAWLPEREGLRRWLLATLRPGDLCLTLGAGDLTTLPDDLLAALR